MIFDGKPTRDITADEIRRLVEEHVPEDRHLDYKQAPYPSTDPGTRELLKDVCAFANTDGGYLIIGVREDGQRRAEALVNVENPEAVRRSILDRCLERIDPRPPGLDIGVVEVDGNQIVVVRVPESDRKPHCAKPDAEHHYFWRRYEDGNKIMSVAEIRECFEGDRTSRALAEIRCELESQRRARTAEREAAQEIDEGNLLQLETEQAFLEHMEREFLGRIGNQPFYRLTATPTPINQVNLRDHRDRLRELILYPPALRNQGWNIRPWDGLRSSAVGLEHGDTEHKQLRVLWNGHLEYWASAADASFRWDEMFCQTHGRVYLFPYAIIEPAVCFVLLVRDVCRVANYAGEVRLGLGLYNIRGRYLAPHAPETLGYLHARACADQPGGPQPFGRDHLVVGPVVARAGELPGTVAWDLVKHVYYRFGYADTHVPLFDAEHHCILGQDRSQGGSGI